MRGTLLLVSTLTVMAGATISPALPGIEAHFTEVPNATFWVRLILTLPALFIALGAPVAGVVVDRFGRKPLLLFSTALYGLAGAAGFMLDALWPLLASRALLGLAVAGVMTSVTTLITDYFRGDSRAGMLGWQATFMGLGGVVFLIAGGVLADLSWRLPFLIYLFSLLLLPLVLFVLHEPTRPRPARREGNKGVPWAFLGFIYTAMLLGQVMFYTVPVQLPFYLRDLLGANATLAGTAVAVATLFYALTSSFYRRIKGWLDYLPILSLGFFVAGLGFAVLSFAGAYALVFLGLAISGVGFGFIVPNLNTWTAERVSDAGRGRALGGLTTALFLGQFLSPVVAQPLAAALGSANMYLATGVLGGLLALVLVLARRAAPAWQADKS